MTLFVQLIIVIVAVVNNNNNINFPICYPGCLLIRHHSQISKEDHGLSIVTCLTHTIDVH